MLIEIEQLNNPNEMNFYFGQKVLHAAYVEYAELKDQNASASVLIKNLFKISGIKRILLTADFLFVEKEESFSWDILAPQIMAEVVDFDFSALEKEAFITDKSLGIEALIKAIIRPYIESHRGHIVFKGYQNGVVRVSLQGACGGCQHAGDTLKNVVEITLKSYIPEIEKVERVE